MRRRGRQLGAVTGPARLEYVLPASIADKIGGTGNYAYCVSNADDLVTAVLEQGAFARAKSSIATDREARIKSLSVYSYSEEVIADASKKAAAKAKREAKAGNAFTDLANQLRAEIGRLRSQGVKGPIPVCITRATGKRGAGLERYFRRANATHERFHADARRLEADADVDAYSCYKRMDALTDPYIGNTPLRYHSLVHFASMKSKLATEELLARVEEVRQACERKKGKKQGDCEPTITNIVKYMREPEARGFLELVRGVKADYGTPLNVVRAAVRSCKVSGLSGARRPRKRSSNALLVAALVPGIPPL